MPYVKLETAKELTEAQTALVYEILAKHISLIPSKNIDNAMMQVASGRQMFMHGAPGEYTFLEVRLSGPAPLADKDAYVAAVSRDLEEQVGIDPAKTYVNILELDGWGARGHYFSR